MIFVSVGTNEARFDRLIEAVAGVALDEELVIQYGHSSPGPATGATLVDFLSFDEMGESFAGAGLVTLVEEPNGLAEALRNDQVPATVIPAASSLASDLRQFLEDAIPPHSTSVAA
jgi:UDP-N-acetylglucosamine transferase subunit ALG13